MEVQTKVDTNYPKLRRNEGGGVDMGAGEGAPIFHHRAQHGLNVSDIVLGWLHSLASLKDA